MAGPAQKARPTQASIRAATGAASLMRRRGMTVSSGVQNRRMPLRLSAMIQARPDTSMPITSDQAAIDGVSPMGVSRAAESKANLATKPDSGGKPAMSSAQAIKAMPRKAIAAGM